MANQKPSHVIRLGKIKAAIWANPGEHSTRHNVTFERLYMHNNEWHQSESFGRDDLPVLAKVADMAHTWIFEHAAEQDVAAPENAAS